MEITFKTSPKAFEKANYLFEQAIQSLQENPTVAAQLGFSIPQIEQMKTFRGQLVKGFKKAAQNG